MYESRRPISDSWKFSFRNGSGDEINDRRAAKCFLRTVPDKGPFLFLAHACRCSTFGKRFCKKSVAEESTNILR